MMLSSHRTQQGFVLVGTLWMLTIMTIAASFFAVWTQRAIEQASLLHTDMQASIDSHSTVSTLLYIMGTQRMTYAGIITPHPERPRQVNAANSNPFERSLDLAPQGHEIHVDNQAYHGLGEIYFALQDEGGLVGLRNEQNTWHSGRLLQLLGVPDAARAPMLAKFQDYIDADDAYRLNGAESQDYQELELTPPTNRLLRAPKEAYKILGWAQQRMLWDNNHWEQNSSTLTSGTPNLNTAPLTVLQTIPGIDANGAERLLQFRKIHPLDSIMRVYQALGLRIQLDEFSSVFMASDYFRLTLWHPDSQRMQQIHLQLTPFKFGEKPWKIHYSLDQPLYSTYRNQDILYAKTHLLPTALPTD